MTAYVHGPQSENYDFTSALPVQLLVALAPSLMPMIEPPPDGQRGRHARSACVECWRIAEARRASRRAVSKIRKFTFVSLRDLLVAAGPTIIARHGAPASLAYCWSIRRRRARCGSPPARKTAPTKQFGKQYAKALAARRHQGDAAAARSARRTICSG